MPLQGADQRAGPGITVLPEAAMCPRRALEQRRASRVALAAALAAQWFGELLVAALPADEWLLWGLQGYAVGLFMKTAYGASELAYLRLQQRDAARISCRAAFGSALHQCNSATWRLSRQHTVPASIWRCCMRAASQVHIHAMTDKRLALDGGVCAQVVAADSGLVPPLSWRSAADGALHAAERLHCGSVARLKAAAVMHILASKCGNDAFLSILRSLLQNAAEAAAGAQQQGAAAARGGVVGSTGGDPRVLSTQTLLRKIAQVQLGGTMRCSAFLSVSAPGLN
jgi:hypothetical protein